MAPLLPSGISASSISGLVGLTCTALPVGAEPKDWLVSTGSRSLKYFKLISCFSSALAPVCCTDNSHGERLAITIVFFSPLIGNVKAILFPSVATRLTLAREG